MFGRLALASPECQGIRWQSGSPVGWTPGRASFVVARTGNRPPSDSVCRHMRREPSEAPLVPLLLGVMLVLTIFAVVFCMRLICARLPRSGASRTQRYGSGLIRYSLELIMQSLALSVPSASGTFGNNPKPGSAPRIARASLFLQPLPDLLPARTPSPVRPPRIAVSWPFG